MIPITAKKLKDWAGPQLFHDGTIIFEQGAVNTVSFESPFVRGTLQRGDRCITSQFEIMSDGTADNQCPCRDSTERGIICAHVVALGLELIRRETDPERARKVKEEQRRAERLQNFDESAYLQRVPAGTKGAVSASLQLRLAEGWFRCAATDSIPLTSLVTFQKKTMPVDKVSTRLPLRFSEQDEALLYVIEDISEGPAQSQLQVGCSDFINLLKLHIGKPLLLAPSDDTITVNAAPMASRFRASLDKDSGELILMIHTELPFMDSDQLPVYLLSNKEAWIYDAKHFWPLENLLPKPLHAIYQQPIVVGRESVLRFLQTELALIKDHIQVDSDLTLDLLTIEPADPSFRLLVQGSPASLSATLFAEYEQIECIACKASPSDPFAIPDPDDLLRYLTRNQSREEQALEQVVAFGLRGNQGDSLTPIVGCREVLNFLGQAVPWLRRKGWKVELQGKIEGHMETLDFATPIVRVNHTASSDWFEVGFEYEQADGQSLSEAEIQRALLKGDAYLEKNNRVILLDADAIHSTKSVFEDCACGEGTQPGTFRMNQIYAAYVQSSLDGLDGIDIEADEKWQAYTRQQQQSEPASPLCLDDSLQALLRPYQKKAVHWLRFLEENTYGGILADEMGLGKTVETLAWLSHERIHKNSKGLPSLIVCPTSLVENWAEEADRFVPSFKVLILSGPDRHTQWDQIEGSDMVITSYALMRRDIDRYDSTSFACVVLDEAQHIKNRSTQNALAAKRLTSFHKLVLTGTPIENSVTDLWSIMDFLMPGYLGSSDTFKIHYEQPIAQSGGEAELAQRKLRKKLQPFMLRRLKRDVAKDLPPKIEKIATCSLTKDQHLVYQQLLETSQRKISDMVSAQGFNRSRMEILKTLLRLRQICCHLDLLKLKDLKSQYPSGKMDLFFELLDEAVDGGHRILVFSQFTSMLAILKNELEQRSLTYCYLDGSTKERQRIVKLFNKERSIPVFLISLKAGGTGLNLTGADMVIHFDPWWNPAVEQQATDRAYRIGQKRTVYSVKLITKNTVEEKVLAMQKKKKSVIDATLSSDEEVIGKMDWNDVQELLSLA